MGYKRDVIKGISYIGSLRFMTKIIGFLETIVLARILAPDQFGAYGIALLSLGLLEVLTETGVNVVLVQEEDIDKYIDSAWIVSILRGLLISAILYYVAPFIANFFHAPNATTLLLFISIVPLLRGFINPSVVKFQKELMFGRDFGYRFILLLIDTAVSIIVTYITKQPIGIVIGLLSGVVVELVLSFFIVSPRPSFNFRKEYISKIFHRGKWVTATGIFDYLFENTDNIVVGRMLGAASLGVYQLAYSLAVFPLSEIGKVFLYVTMPVFVKMFSDFQKLKSAFWKSVIIVSAVTIPIVALLIIFPSVFVIILGPKWAAVTAVIPFLAVLGLVRALSGLASSLFLSAKKQEYTMVITLVIISGLVISIVPLVTLYGIVGAGIAALGSSLLTLPVIGFYLYRIFRKKR